MTFGACGTGGKAGGDAAQFRGQIDRLCEEANGRAGQLGLSDPAAARQAYEVRQEQLRRMRALEPPGGDIWDQAKLESFLSWFGNVVVRLELVASAQEQGDRAMAAALMADVANAVRETREAAKAYRLSECAGPE